ncbi:MAG TPA: ABC transporter substrate-binding protein [Kribbella sp.]|jgi:branched-chain amino acid transport system substrate-binding protein
MTPTAHRRGTRRTAALAGLAGMALAVAACAPGGGASAQTGDGPIRLAYMGILTGPNATKGSTHAFELAIKEINANGGIAGRQVEFQTFDTDITPEGAARATSLALRYKPAAIVGFGVSSGLKASMAAIKGANIPVIHNTLGSLTSAKNLGSDLVFRMSPTTTQYAHAANDYLIKDRGAKSILMIHTEDAAPTEGAAKVVEDAKSKNVSTTVRAVPPAVTDLTEPILAAAKADAIWEWGYAPTDALTVKQAAQNNVKVPIMTFTVGTAMLNGLIPLSLASDDVLSVANCGALVLDNPVAKDFVAKYEKEYGVPPHDGLEPRNYDSVYLLKAAIEKAGSTDGPKVGAALKQVSRDGVCGKLQADALGNFYRNVPIIQWGGGKAKLAKLEENVASDF